MKDKKKSKYKVFAVFGSNGKVILYRDFEILPGRWIKIGDNEPYPIEDYGDWMLFRDDVTEEEAFERFLKAM